LQIVQDRVQQNNVDVIQHRGKMWRLNLDGLRAMVPDLMQGLGWATGVAVIEPEIEVLPPRPGDTSERTSVQGGVHLGTSATAFPKSQRGRQAPRQTVLRCPQGHRVRSLA
jgi:hypothetical protein